MVKLKLSVTEVFDPNPHSIVGGKAINDLRIEIPMQYNLILESNRKQKL